MKRLSDLRIMMTADAVGGVWTYASSLASALAARGTDVTLVVQGPSPREDQRAMISERSVRLIEAPLALEWQDPEARDLAAARRFFTSLERQLEPDLVHLNSFREATFGWKCPVVIAAHSCVNSWAIACNDTKWLSAPRWRHYTKLVAAGLRHAQTWVCPSHAFHDAIVDLYQPHSAGFVVWNGIAPANRASEQKEDFILAAGRMWDDAKNLSALAQAAPELDWPVLVAGPAADTDLSSALRFQGQVPRDELRRLMQRAAIFTSPARYEPFGLSVLEAAAAGCALVLSDIPTFRELWDQAALFVDPTDADELRRRIAELCANENKRAQLQQAAARRSVSYSLRRMADNYAALYQSLLAPTANAISSSAVQVPA